MSGPGVKSSLLVEYRCRAKGCLLLRVWQTPDGLQFTAPAHQSVENYSGFARYQTRTNRTIPVIVLTRTSS
jgi:hypothetical protein